MIDYKNYIAAEEKETVIDYVFEAGKMLSIFACGYFLAVFAFCI